MLHFQKHSDDRYMQAIRNNENLIIKEFYNYAFTVSRRVLQDYGLQDDQLFQDVYQDSFCILLRNAQRTDFTLTSQLSTYLIGICKKLTATALKRHNKVVSLTSTQEITDELTPFEKYAEAYENMDDRKKQAIELEFEKMRIQNKDCYQLLDLSLRQEVTNQDIAKRLNKGIDVVKTQKSRCLGYLRKAVFKRLNYD